jgi:hypothetical protein
VRSLFAWVAACAFALAFLHVAVFLLSLAGVIFTTRATYNCLRNRRPSFRVAVAVFAAWTVFYFLSIGPFIAVSEAERKLFDRSYLGPFGKAYRPVMVVAALPRTCAEPLLWYARTWIPRDATGLPVWTLGKGESYQVAMEPFVGTWRNELGTVFHFRPDGTVRYRFRGEKQIRYLEWTLRSDEFAFYQYSSRYSESPVAWFARRVMMNDTPTDRYRVAQTGPAQFQLHHSTGTTIIFTAVQDTALESAP